MAKNSSLAPQMALSRLSLLLLAALALSSLPILAIARGGDAISNRSGHLGQRTALPKRRLFEEKEPQITEEMTRGYMSNSELEMAVKKFAKRCANISRGFSKTTISIGKSVNGVPLWVIEISDKPGQKEAEPAFKFIGNVHGDEPVGRELLVLLANWLCNNYMQDSLATLIVRSVHLHILPTMNPDGFALRRRGNANNIDLNRDFPDQFYHMNDVISLRQPETKAIMDWVKQQHFTASASLHGGALVANYPWDGTQDTRKHYYACPDDKTFRYMATVYSRSHYNMSLSKEFEGGIINGAFWYPIYGGMQDWNYIYGGCFELTLEISDTKWPKASELPIIWEYNRMSMLNLVASIVKTGVHGRVFAANTGRPLPASVIIRGIDYKVNASWTFGDYHRMLAPRGNYEVTASMPGFQTRSTRIQLEDEAVNLDFILNPEGDAHTPSLLANGCDCSCHGNASLVGFLRGIHLELFLLLVILLFLCFLFKRKKMLKFPRYREPNAAKRDLVV
ncbi:Carboxypeptidase SOL1 [Ananas comosus]|uniref:Carboxypeptidase SOL1 n=1 Tax=Ananas comosus TaxID=4615 RepID=A0A199W7U2_ANACO|nr:Carboxypeptidase SOL1 [Ananas comosus]